MFAVLAVPSPFVCGIVLLNKWAIPWENPWCLILKRMMGKANGESFSQTTPENRFGWNSVVA